MKVAILIPTMGRPDFIERTVLYYHLAKCTHPIYIGDASNSEEAVRITEIIKKYSELDIRYFHWEGVGVIATLVKLANEAAKKFHFCAFHGDDDYFIPSSLTVCGEFLAGHSTYRTAQGRAALFTLEGRGAYGKIQAVGDYWGVNELEQDTGEARLHHFARHYFVSQFSVHRVTEFLDDSMKYQTLRDHPLSELLHCFTFAIMGKSKFLDCLFLVRNSHAGREQFSFPDWVTSDYFAQDYNSMIDALANALYLSDGVPLHLGKQQVSDVMKLRLVGAKTKPPESQPANVLVKVRRVLPIWIKNYFWEILLNPRDLRLLTSRKSHYFDEFQPILQSIKG